MSKKLSENGNTESTRWKKASRRSWTEKEHSTRTMQLREYTLKELWEIFVDDRRFGADAMCRQVNVQSKAVLDNIKGWEDEERWVGSKFPACMWIYTKEALTGGQILNQEQEEYLKERMMSIMLCTKWVCAGTFVDRDWVSASKTIPILSEKFGACYWITGLMFRAWYN